MHLFTKVLISTVSILLLFEASQAQNIAAYRKTGNAYRSNFQRIGSSPFAYHTLEIRDNGSLWAWGNNSSGQLGDGTTINRTNPVQIGTDTKWVQAVTSNSHSVAIKSDGTLWAWGSNSLGQFGDGTKTQRNIPIQVGTENKWVKIAAGIYHTVALKSDGTLWAWGSNPLGQLGDGTNTDKNSPVQVGTDNKWVSITAGGYHTIALKSDGSLWAWGYNLHGQLGDGTTINKNTPIQVGSDTKWVSITAGGNHTIGLKSDGTLWACGWNNYGVLGVGPAIQQSTSSLTQIGVDNKWVSVSSGIFHCLALKSDGTLWTWGWNFYGQLGDGATIEKNIPTQVGSDTKWVSVIAGYDYSMALKSDGTLWTWGWNFYGQLADGTTVNKSTAVRVSVVDNKYVSISVGGNHTTAVKSNGTIWTWGLNHYGQLGDGSTMQIRNKPMQISTDSNWIRVSAGGNHTIALRNNGTLWAWGDNSYGQLGDGTTNSKNRPVQIGTDNKWVSISAAGVHTMAIKSDGTLWGWGWNFDGQVGDGTRIQRDTPVQIGIDNKWINVAASYNHTVALKSDGTLWSWGRNLTGGLGDSVFLLGAGPRQIGNDNKWINVAVGELHTVATKSDGTLWTWGGNFDGQLGDGTNINRFRPIQLGADNSWVDAVGGYSHTVAFKSDGTLWAWGWHRYGQLGIGNATIQQNIPVQNTDQVNVIALAQGGSANHSASVKVDKRTICLTGRNEFGQLGYISNFLSTTYNCINESNTTPLPLSLVNFSAESISNQVNLQWQTSNEVQVGYFIVERSVDGSNFKSIGKVLSKGDGDYRFVDQLPMVATVYYRLQMVDKDGSYTYSKVVAVKLRTQQNTFSIFPNPVQDRLSVAVNSTKSETITLQITDMQGKLLHQQAALVNAGNTGLTINTSKLSRGSYVLIVKGSFNYQQQQFIKE